MDNSTHNSHTGEVTRQKLVDDLRVLVLDAEELVKAAAGTVAEKSHAELTTALERLKTSSRRIEEKAVKGVEAADTIIREHPYESLGVAFGLGLLLGVLVIR